jgi:hypothetical protein
MLRGRMLSEVPRLLYGMEVYFQHRSRSGQGSWTHQIKLLNTTWDGEFSCTVKYVSKERHRAVSFYRPSHFPDPPCGLEIALIRVVEVTEP